MSVVYIKEDPQAKRSFAKKRDRAIFAIMAIVGLSSILFATWPIVVWQIKTLPKLSAQAQDAPIPEGKVLSSGIFQSSNVQIIQEPDGFSYFATDYKPHGKRPKAFLISIPRLKVKDATVKVDNLNFYQNLSHFPGSALPGEVGNSFITGHSVLPQFFDPENYKTIFTKLSDLEVGDDIFAKVGDKTYHYTVQYSKIVDPHDMSVLSPIAANSQNLTLMTCVPPGTSTKRLVVITSLI